MTNSTTRRDTNPSVRDYMDRLAREHFYGAVTVRYENGSAVHIRREESILPTNLTEKPNDESLKQPRS